MRVCGPVVVAVLSGLLLLAAAARNMRYAPGYWRDALNQTRAEASAGLWGGHAPGAEAMAFRPLLSGVRSAGFFTDDFALDFWTVAPAQALYQGVQYALPSLQLDWQYPLGHEYVVLSCRRGVCPPGILARNRLVVISRSGRFMLARREGDR